MLAAVVLAWSVGSRMTRLGAVSAIGNGGLMFLVQLPGGFLVDRGEEPAHDTAFNRDDKRQASRLEGG